MHRAVKVSSQGLKMSVCNEFVEHIWKPGSCKNCFHPRSDHRNSSAPSDGKVGNLPVLHNLNGIRIKSENSQQDDDIVIAALYSKPTIAVKPTMITSDTAEMWAELNGTETLTQVSWKLSSTSNTVLKSGDIPRVILENLKKPFNQNYSLPHDNTSKYLFNRLQNSEKNMEINAVNNLTYVSHFGGQADKATFIKEKLPISYKESNQMNCSGTQSPTDRSSPRGTLLAREGKNGTGLLNPEIQDQSRYARDIKLKNNLNNPESGTEKNLHFSKIKVSVHSESDTKSDTVSYISVKDIPVATPTNTSSHTFEFQSPKVYTQNSVAQTQQFTHTEALVQSETEGSQSEPIYAESTKRKCVSGKTGMVTKSEWKIENAAAKKENCTSEDKQLSLSNERTYQESMTQVSAKITVMAAHTEEDNRTIYLSSPDSAVGVQWNCTSPSSTSESSSPTFFWGERSRDMKSFEVSKNYNSSFFHKNQGNSPVASPKIIKPEEIHMRISSPTHSSGFLSSGSHQKDLLEAHDRCLPSGDRRRFYQAMKSRQCRIDEEEEEECPITQQPRTTAVANGPLVKSNTVCNHDERSRLEEKNSWKGMSKSASCPIELSKVNDNPEESNQPPPPPPKKQPRSPPKLIKSSTELGTFSLGSVESLGESFKATNSNPNINVSFSAGSMDSLDSKTCSEGGQSVETLNSPKPNVDEKKHFAQVSLSVDSGEDPQKGALQPPPLPVKKSINRACSAPDNSAWGRAYPPSNGVNVNSPRLNPSHSEGNVCGDETMLSGCPLSPGDKHAMFSSSESLEKCCRGLGHRNEIRNRNFPQSRVTQAMSASELNVSSHTSSGSSLQLHHLLSNIDSREGMYAKLSGLYAQSTRRLMTKCEDFFMRDQKKELHFNENNWSLFKLSSNKPCCKAGDAIYYCATCAKDPHNNYAVKMCRTEDTKTSYCSLSLPVHYNIQQDCGHFVATVPSSMLHPPETSKDCQTNESSLSVGSLREQECVVVITREVPHRTTAEFVKESVSIHKAQPEVYERQVCLLLLQLCNGLEHLKEHGIIHRDLCLENLLLVHCQTSPNKMKDGKYVPRLIVSNFSKAKQRPGSEDLRPRRDKTRLAPEIMVASQYKKFDEFQTGILIYELLHQSNPFEDRTSLQEQEYTQKDLPSLPNLSVYSRGLQHLAHLLLEADPIKRIRISEAKRILQCLLWGPRKDLTDQPFSHEEALHCALQNWIDMKRALLTMKFAENALEPKHNISLEDWLCCQYLASADPCYLYKTLKLIKLI